MRIWGINSPNTSETEVAAEPDALRVELRGAYRRGRNDERSRHRRSPLITTGLFAVVGICAVILFYAAREGSFSRGGQVVDAQLSHATGEVIPGAVNEAASRTGAALQAAGERIKTKGVALDAHASTPVRN